MAKSIIGNILEKVGASSSDSDEDSKNESGSSSSSYDSSVSS